jgi:hypothetical protein
MSALCRGNDVLRTRLAPNVETGLDQRSLRGEEGSGLRREGDAVARSSNGLDNSIVVPSERIGEEEHGVAENATELSSGAVHFPSQLALGERCEIAMADRVSGDVHARRLKHAKVACGQVSLLP